MPNRIRPLQCRDSARTLLGQRARRALGLRGTRIDHLLGETALHISIWSPRELQDIYDHRGGTITGRTILEPRIDGTVAELTRVTLTVRIPNLGTVTAACDWDHNDPDEDDMRQVPVIRGLLASAGAR
ncbi:hypothetical protein ACFWIB_15335 [Streptomyces sp. NPDC127051]|uniref:hypothetical protein n=1 Tax=Streptomyces sp. NPDC127051 TaxID=3347119 RepID=UPI003664C29B